MTRQIVWCIVTLLGATPALAQSAYVAAGAGADVFRPAHVEGRGLPDASAGGEATAISARVGTAITDRWGVELEFTRAAEIEREAPRGFPVPLLTRQIATGQLRTFEVLPIFESTVRFSRRNTTLDAVAWVAQTIGSRVDLVYLGGVAFTRVVEEMHASISPTIVFPGSSLMTTYGAGPVAGLEARIHLTDHAILIPGVRLHALSGDTGAAWLVRPAVALGWQF